MMTLGSAQTEEKDMQSTYGVVFTTIPSRMKSLHHVIDSWIIQKQIRPSYIFIMVPQKYRRFKRKSGNSNNLSFKQVVETELYTHYHNQPLIAGERVAHPYADILHLLQKGNDMKNRDDEKVVIHVCETVYDDGPALKYSGLFQLVKDWQLDQNTVDIDINGVADNTHSIADNSIGNSGNNDDDEKERNLASVLIASQYSPPEHWIVCDDDVAYLPDTLSKYYFSQHVGTDLSSSSAEANTLAPQTPLQLQRTVLTHFSEDYRIILKLKEEPFKRPMMQIQGVDTVLIPHALLLAHTRGESDHYPSLYVEKFRLLLSYIHTLCPSSFYQDDYLISFAMNIGNTDIRSIWNSENVAKHVDGLSKQYHQMHMSKLVHDREAETRHCLMEHADDIIEHVF